MLVCRYKGKGDSDVMLEGTLAGKKTQLEFPVTFPAQADHDFIPRLWATRRVGYLLDEIRLRGENKELKDEVTTLARKYGIVTPYTAYLIIEDEQRRGVPVAQRTLRNFEADREVLDQTRKQFEALKLDKAGDQAIGSARAAKALKEATNAKAAAKTATSKRSRQTLALLTAHRRCSLTAVWAAEPDSSSLRTPNPTAPVQCPSRWNSPPAKTSRKTPSFGSTAMCKPPRSPRPSAAA